MRRMLAAGAAMLVCLVIGGVPALAQEESGEPPTTVEPATVAMAPVVFTGENTCGMDTSEWLADDPRVTGPCSLTMDHQGGDIPVGFVAVGDYTVNGPEGDWVGTWAIMAGYDFPTAFRNFMVLEGTEAYEGWAVWAWTTAPEGSQEGPGDLEGVIYEGSAPRLEWPEE